MNQAMSVTPESFKAGAKDCWRAISGPPSRNESSMH